MKKKKLLIIIPILLVLLIVAVLALLYFTTDMFKSNDVLFAKYFMQNGEILDIVENANTDAQNEFKKTNSYTSNGELLVTIENGANVQEVKATTSSRHDAKNGRFYSDMTLKNGEADLLKMSYINSGDVYAIKCDDILANYIGVRNSDLKTFARNMGMSEEEIASVPDSIDLDSISNIGQIAEEEKQHIIDTYSNVIMESISEDKFVKREKEQIMVDGMNYEANAYKLTLDESTMKQILVNCLNTLKNDNKTLVIIRNMLSTLNRESELDTAKISEQIGTMATKIQESSTGKMIIDIIVYEAKGQTIRTSIENLDEGKITIDKSNANGSNKVLISIESNYKSYSTDIETGESTTTNNVEISQIILEKKETDINITNNITFIPDTSNMAQLVKMNTTLGKIQNNRINNESNITISNSDDGIDIETINTSYVQNIQLQSEVEEIMELKNSNTIIFNNYTAEQLAPFLENLGNKISQVLPNKIGQLAIDLNTNQSDTINDLNNLTNITNTTNNIFKVLQMVGSAVGTIANVNGIDIENTVAIGVVGIGISVYDRASETILDHDLRNLDSILIDTNKTF